MDASMDVEPQAVEGAVQVFFVFALFMLCLGFVLLVLIRLLEVKDVPRGVRCLNCAGPLFPLLDSNHSYHGEAACLKCGHLHEGVPWPRRRPVPPSVAKPPQTT
jgi:hypothetical protein